MLPSTFDELKKRLEINEGCRLKAYQDTKGIWTIGYGFNLQRASVPAVCASLSLAGINVKGITSLEDLSKLEITQEEADKLFANDIPKYITKASGLLDSGVFDSMTPARQIALVDFIYNEGGADFPVTLHILNQAQKEKNAGNLTKAHALFMVVGDHLRASEYDREVGARASRNIFMLETGSLCDPTWQG